MASRLSSFASVCTGAASAFMVMADIYPPCQSAALCSLHFVFVLVFTCAPAAALAVVVVIAGEHAQCVAVGVHQRFLFVAVRRVHLAQLDHGAHGLHV